jgi:hypothetical protein
MLRVLRYTTEPITHILRTNDIGPSWFAARFIGCQVKGMLGASEQLTNKNI